VLSCSVVYRKFMCSKNVRTGTVFIGPPCICNLLSVCHDAFESFLTDERS